MSSLRLVTVGSSEHVAGVYEESSTFMLVFRLHRYHVHQRVLLGFLAIDDFLPICGWKKVISLIRGILTQFSHIHTHTQKEEQ